MLFQCLNLWQNHLRPGCRLQDPHGLPVLAIPWGHTGKQDLDTRSVPIGHNSLL